MIIRHGWLKKKRKKKENTNLQQVRLISQRDGLGHGDFEGIRRNAAEESHGVGATEEWVVLTRFCWNRLLLLILKGGAYKDTNMLYFSYSA